MREHTDEEILAALAGPEHIFREPDGDWIRCVPECNNTPDMDGFSPCLRDGYEVEPTVDGPWNEHLYVCLSCNRIVNADTLEVLGVRSVFAEAWSTADDCDTCWYLLSVGPDSAEEQWGDDVVTAKLRAHIDSGHRLTSEEA